MHLKCIFLLLLIFSTVYTAKYDWKLDMEKRQEHYEEMMRKPAKERSCGGKCEYHDSRKSAEQSARRKSLDPKEPPIEEIHPHHGQHSLPHFHPTNGVTKDDRRGNMHMIYPPKECPIELTRMATHIYKDGKCIHVGRSQSAPASNKPREQYRCFSLLDVLGLSESGCRSKRSRSRSRSPIRFRG